MTRAFKLYNPTDHAALRPASACFASVTAPAASTPPPKVIVNTANISTTSNETITSNNMDSATITAEDTDDFTPVPNPPPVKPTPNNPIAMTIAGSDVSLTRKASLRRNRVVVGSTARVPAPDTAKLISLKTVRVGNKKVRRGSVLARGTFSFDSAGERSLNLRLTKKGRIAVKKTRKALLKLSSGESKLVRIR